MTDQNETAASRHAVNSHNHKTNAKPFLYILAGLIIIGLSFYGGVQYQKGHSRSSQATSSGFGQAGSNFSSRFNSKDRVVGTVSAISSTSITVNNQQTNSSVTANISSSTQISDNGQTVASSDISTGDTVFMRIDTSSPPNALRIQVNPSSSFSQPGNPSSTNVNND